MGARWIGALGASLAAATAHAQGPSRASLVEIYVVTAEDLDAQQMESVTSELLSRLDVRVKVTRLPRVDLASVITPRVDAERALARAWIDLSDAEAATLYVVDGPWERVLVRHFPRASEEVTREALAHILETAVDALLRGGRIGVERETLLAPTPPAPSSPSPSLAPPPIAPSPPPDTGPREATLRGELGVGYEAALFGPGDAVRHGPLISLFAGTPRGRLRIGGLASVQLRVPSSVTDAPVGLRFESIAARTLVVVDVPLTHLVALRGGIGGGFDVDHVSPRTGTQPDARSASAETLLVPVGRLAFGATAAVLQHFAVELGAVVDLDFSGTRYVALAPDRSVEDFRPWSVRPGLVLGVSAR